MTPSQNKQLLRDVFEQTAKGNGRPFVDAMADEVSWSIIGSTAWSKTYAGKKAVIKELLGPLNANLAGSNTITASRFIAEGDTVVVEGKGHNVTKSGEPYENTYCWIIRFEEGKIVEITEYADTQLIVSVLDNPP